jgi:hypothetical protein
MPSLEWMDGHGGLFDFEDQFAEPADSLSHPEDASHDDFSSIASSFTPSIHEGSADRRVSGMLDVPSAEVAHADPFDDGEMESHVLAFVSEEQFPIEF